MFYFYIFLIIVLTVIGIFYLVRSVVILVSFLYRAPFTPLERFLIKETIKLLDIKSGDRFIDVGSGDGRVVFYVAKNYPDVQLYKGLEINRVLFWGSNFLKTFSKNKNKVFFERQDVLKYGYKSVNKVYMYLFPELVNDVMSILEKDLPSGSIVVSPIFKISDKYTRSGELIVKDIKFRGKIKKIYVWKKN